MYKTLKQFHDEIGYLGFFLLCLLDVQSMYPQNRKYGYVLLKHLHLSVIRKAARKNFGGRAGK